MGDPAAVAESSPVTLLCYCPQTLGLLSDPRQSQPGGLPEAFLTLARLSPPYYTSTRAIVPIITHDFVSVLLQAYKRTSVQAVDVLLILITCRHDHWLLGRTMKS